MSEAENYYALQAGKELAEGTSRIVESDNGAVHVWDHERRNFERLKTMEDNVLAMDAQNINTGSLKTFIDALVTNAVPEETVVTFGAEDRRFTAVLDFYDEEGGIGYRNKTVSYKPKFSREFNSWLHSNNNQMSQDSFSEFLDAQLESILDPSGSELMDICSTLQVNRDAFFSRTKRLEDGSVQLEFKENQEASGGAKNMQLPKEFKIAVPLFKPSISDNEPELVELTARLFYRLRNGQITFWFRLVEVDNAVLAVVSDLYKEVESQLPKGVPLYEQD